MKYHTLFFRKLGKMSHNLSSAAVVICALRVNYVYMSMYSYFSQKLFLSEVSKTLVSAEEIELLIGEMFQI